MKTRSFVTDFLALAWLACLPWNSRAATLVVTNLADSGTGSLRQAIADARSGDLITIAANGVVTLINGELFITNDLNIVGPGPTNLAIDAHYSSRVLEISNANVTLDGLALINGELSVQDTNDSGGGILVDSNVSFVLNDSTLSDNTVLNGNGGAIEINSGSVVAMTNSTIFFNIANSFAGGIFSEGTLTLDHCSVSNNTAGANGGAGSGGGIYSNGALAINHTTIGSNRANYGDGGGIDNDANGVVTMADCTLSDNLADNGGCIANQGGVVTITNSTLSVSYAVANGGGVFSVNNGTLTVINSVLSGNEANAFSTTIGGGGGGIFTAGTLTVNHSTLSRNYAYNPDSGGGVYNESGGAVSLTNTIFSENYANNGYGGGVVNKSNGVLTVTDCTFSGNGAFNGGAISNEGTNTLNRCTVNENAAQGPYGGGIYNGGVMSVAACTLSGNIGYSYGGGIYNFGALSVANSTLCGNLSRAGNFDADGFGGGIFNAGTNALNNSTVSGNSADYGGGIENYGSSTLRMTNTIVAGNLVSTAYPDILGSFFGVNNLTNGNPELAPLGNYGGPVQTMPPLAGSPAIDAGSDSVLFTYVTDQRGYPRKSGAHVDIGAVEAQYAPANNPPQLIGSSFSSSGGGGTNGFQFTFTNVPDADFTVLASTNLALPLANWIPIGNAAQNPPGQYQFTDPGATNYPQRFYQVVSP